MSKSSLIEGTHVSALRPSVHSTEKGLLGKERLSMYVAAAKHLSCLGIRQPLHNRCILGACLPDKGTCILAGCRFHQMAPSPEWGLRTAPGIIVPLKYHTQRNTRMPAPEDLGANFLVLPASSPIPKLCCLPRLHLNEELYLSLAQWVKPCTV